MDNILIDALIFNGRKFQIYGDLFFLLRPRFQVSFIAGFASAAQIELNPAMISVHESEEWTYKDLEPMWTSHYFTRMLKVRKAAIALMYE